MVRFPRLVILFGHTYQITAWKKGLLEGMMDELQRKEAGSFRGDGTVVCSLGLGTDMFQVFFTVFPYLITNAVWKELSFLSH